jgi:hypothetical protein
MIHTTDNFFNKVATDVRQRFFPNENHGTTENKNYWKATKAIEDFNNGVLTYKVFIGRVARATKSNNATIHNIVEKYITSFGNYQYKPRKLYSNETIQNTIERENNLF